MSACGCALSRHDARLVVLTGGPGAGKTTVLEVMRRNFCEHVAVLPEAASLLFGGGFPRILTGSGRRASQRAIFHVQRELEQGAIDSGRYGLILCDRGTIDGAAYWPGDVAEFWRDVRSTSEAELARYAAVIHLRTPSATGGYGFTNPLRIEDAAEARAIDGRIERAWSAHPKRTIVENHTEFLVKVERTRAILEAEVPACCRGAPIG